MTSIMTFPERVNESVAKRVLAELNQPEHFERVFVEGVVGKLEPTRKVGCLILGHERPNGEPGYYAAVYRDSEPEEGLFFSIVPDGEEGKGVLAVFAKEGWREVSGEEIGRHEGVSIVLSTLEHHIDGTKTKHIPVGKLRVSQADVPPNDEELMFRLQLVRRGRMNVADAVVPIQLVAPGSVDYCLRFDSKRVNQIVSRVLRGYRPSLLVYWNGTSFVMNDDYPVYLAYLRSELKEVPVAIVGNFPRELVKLKRNGGVELLPPVIVSSEPRYPAPVDAKFKNWQLSQKLKRVDVDPIPATWIAVWMEFADLLSEEVDEKTLHEFIRLHPALLSLYGRTVDSEVRLGNQYRIDLVVRTNDVRESVLLVELEHHRHSIFTASGQPRAEISHAVQQVQDWFRWIRENPNHEFSKSLDGIPPEGLVVAGRSRELTEERRTRLAHLNATNPVRIITYDELLGRFGDAILNRLSDKDD